MSQLETENGPPVKQRPPAKKKRVHREPVPADQLPRDVWHVRHVALFMGRSARWVYALVESDQIPHFRPGGSPRAYPTFNPAKIVAWAQGRA